MELYGGLVLEAQAFDIGPRKSVREIISVTPAIHASPPPPPHSPLPPRPRPSTDRPRNRGKVRH